MHTITGYWCKKVAEYKQAKTAVMGWEGRASTTKVAVSEERANIKWLAGMTGNKSSDVSMWETLFDALVVVGFLTISGLLLGYEEMRGQPRVRWFPTFWRWVKRLFMDGEDTSREVVNQFDVYNPGGIKLGDREIVRGTAALA